MIHLSLVLVIEALLYVFILRPYLEKKADELEFNNRSLGYLEGLYYGDIELGCSVSELRSYLESQLEKAHTLPGNQSLIEYTAGNGYRYCSHTGRDDYKLFVLLCIAQYARNHSNTHLVDWCESKFQEARKIRF